jgi:hypothetical protein
VLFTQPETRRASQIRLAGEKSDGEVAQREVRRGVLVTGERGGVITDKQVEDALDYLRDSARTASVARAQARTLEKYLGVVEAQQKAKASGRSNAAAQDEARSSPEYREALTAWEEAVRRDSEFTMLREAAAARIEAWRTMCSNARAERV